MGDSLRFDYYYGVEAEQFSFYRVPRLLIKDERFKGLSSDAKLLYGLMLDRMALSIKNGWFDEENRAYIHYTVENIMEDLGCAKATCVKVIAELDSKKGIGLIEKKRLGLGRPDIIYVKNFVAIEQTEQKVFSGFHQLYRVQRKCPGRHRQLTARRRSDPPPGGSYFAVAAAIEKTADPAQAVSCGHCRNKYIQYPDDIQFSQLAVKREHGQCQQKSSVKDQSALIDADDIPEIVPVVVEKLHHIKYSGAENAGDHGQKEQGRTLVFGKFGETAVVFQKKHGGDEAQCRHHSIPADGKRTDLKCDWMHDSTPFFRIYGDLCRIIFYTQHQCETGQCATEYKQ